jgi:hypothetical protein
VVGVDCAWTPPVMKSDPRAMISASASIGTIRRRESCIVIRFLLNMDDIRI